MRGELHGSTCQIGCTESQTTLSTIYHTPSIASSLGREVVDIKILGTLISRHLNVLRQWLAFLLYI